MPVLTPALIADVRAKIDSEFGPINSSLLPAEQTLCDAARQKMARCIAEAGTYVRDNAVVTVTGVQAGSSSAPGSLA